MGPLVGELLWGTYSMTYGLPKYLLYACVPSTPDMEEILTPKRPPAIKR